MKKYRATIRCLVPAYAYVTVELPDDATPEQLAEALADRVDGTDKFDDLDFREDWTGAGVYDWHRLDTVPRQGYMFSDEAAKCNEATHALRELNVLPQWELP